MFNLSEKGIGWAQALFNIIFLWGLANIAIGYSAKILGVNVILFACVSFASAALTLLLISGHGKLAKETLKSIDTWAYGVVLLITYVSIFLLFSKVSATEGSLLIMLGMSFSLLASWFFFSRIPTKWQLVGNAIVLVGLSLSFYDTAPENRFEVYLLTFILAIIVVLRVFIAETHKTHTHAKTLPDPMAKCRVIAFVMFIVSLIFTVFTVFIAVLNDFYPEQMLSVLPEFPNLEDFLNPATMIAGLIYGAILMAPLRYLEFASSSKINGENYIAITALAPASTFFWEWSTQSITTLSLKTITQYDLYAGILITLGAFFATASQIRKPKKQEEWKESLVYTPQNSGQIDDSREIIANTLEHFNGDINKSAKALNIKISVINALLMDENKVLAFKKKILKDVERHYRQHVASVDPLTGLPNRSAFMMELRNNSYEGNTYSVLFIDLDKFKPVNDTYGHESGDMVLKGIAERLQNIVPKGSIVTRLGGDEFCICLPKTNKSKALKYIEEIKLSTAKPFKFESKSINVGASIGVASFPEDSDNPEELLKMADKGMYDNK